MDPFRNYFNEWKKEVDKALACITIYSKLGRKNEAISFIKNAKP